MKRRATQLLYKAGRIARSSDTLGVAERNEIMTLRDEIARLNRERTAIVSNMERAVNHPATEHTRQAWGAEDGEPFPRFARAMRRALLELGVEVEMANHIVNTASLPQDELRASV
jgi:hypothetical protein